MFGPTVTLHPEVQTIQSKLQAIVNLTNKVALDYSDGCRNTCILSSYALTHVLQQLGYDEAHPVRVQATVAPLDFSGGAILGSVERPREAAGPGMWHGHLTVAIGKQWLLDPTIDQANNPEWGSEARATPVVIRLPADFWTVSSHPYLPNVVMPVNGTWVKYKLHPRQVGFANARDARRSHWLPLANKILSMIHGLQNESCAVASEGARRVAGGERLAKAA